MFESGDSHRPALPEGFRPHNEACVLIRSDSQGTPGPHDIGEMRLAPAALSKGRDDPVHSTAIVGDRSDIRHNAIPEPARVVNDPRRLGGSLTTR